MATRAELWQQFDEKWVRWRASNHAPAFVQEIVAGLWCVQVLHRPQQQHYGRVYRLLFDPPLHSGEPYYSGWPGDHRGWIRFESKEAARDFYKFATNRISFEEFKSLPSAPLSCVRIEMDENGDFVEPQP